MSERMFIAGRQVGKGMRTQAAIEAYLKEHGYAPAIAVAIAEAVRELGGSSSVRVRRMFNLDDDECAAHLYWLAGQGVLSLRWVGRGRAQMAAAFRRGVDDELWKIVKDYLCGRYGRPVLCADALRSRYRASMPGQPVREWIHRGTGRTAEQMKMAPKGAIFVWCNSAMDYPRRLARSAGRSDLKIVAPSWLSRERLMGFYGDVVLDHAASPCRRELDAYNEYRRRTEYLDGLRGDAPVVVAIDQISPELAPLAEMIQKAQAEMVKACAVPAELIAPLSKHCDIDMAPVPSTFTEFAASTKCAPGEVASGFSHGGWSCAASSGGDSSYGGGSSDSGSSGSDGGGSGGGD